MSLFRWLRVHVKVLLARHTLLIEFCKRCGAQQPVVWTASDDLWAQFSGWTDDGGVLCPTCFDRRAQQRGVLLRWTPTIDRDSPLLP
jgi:hypothetical protein